MGWGDNFELRRFEQDLISHYLESWRTDNVPSIVVNSTWYNRDHHSHVLRFIQEHHVRRVALVSCMDPAIVSSEWFASLDLEVRNIGYYRGQDELDIWALAVDRYFRVDEQAVSADHIDTAYLCFNRKPHWHRRRLFDQLQHCGLLDSGIVTMGDDTGSPLRLLNHDVEPCYLAPNPGKDQYGIVNDIMSLGPSDVWKKIFVNLVTETVFDVDDQWFVSEKIYKPILGMRPFLVYAPNGARSWLNHAGFENYMDDFYDISDVDLNYADNQVLFLQQLCDQPRAYFQQKYKDLLPKIQHNRNQFTRYIDKIKQRLRQGIGS